MDGKKHKKRKSNRIKNNKLAHQNLEESSEETQAADSDHVNKINSPNKKNSRSKVKTEKVKPKRRPGRPPKKTLSSLQDSEETDESDDGNYLFCEDPPLTDEQIAECVPNGKLAIECFICCKRMTKIYELRAHIKLHELVENYDEKALETSPICETLNPHKRNIEASVIRDFLVEEVKAKRYSQFYGILTEADVELHISDSETESEVDGATNKIPHNKYECSLCEITFERRHKALFHQRTAHTKSALRMECDYCGERFIGVQLLIHHLKNQCESDEYPVSCMERFREHLIKVNLEQFQCLADARKELKVRRLNTAEKLFSCNICQKTFLRSEHLTRHKAVHMPDELKMECLVCFKKFNRKDNLRAHMKVHVNEAERDTGNIQTILCQMCGHCFTSKSNYIVHMRRHTCDKPYTCEVCGKGFPKSRDLNSHKITHTGERNFACNICNKSFARSAVLAKHMRVHQGPFHCNYCNESFTRPKELANHLRNHATKLTYKCQVCRLAFNQKEELDAHIKNTKHCNKLQEQGSLRSVKTNATVVSSITVDIPTTIQCTHANVVSSTETATLCLTGET